MLSSNGSSLRPDTNGCGHFSFKTEHRTRYNVIVEVNAPHEWIEEIE